mmetsp:Transcript_128069/g.250802  ORF Transcript_128069/g.250802 Transcript_128069/m.250802 type:complete len:405 (-) Transcript_128069:108-1322(-)
MDVLGHHLEDAPELAHIHAGAGSAAGLLCDQGHREALIQDPELALGGFLVRGVQEDAPIQQRAVHVGDHGANVPRGVTLVLAILDVLENRRVPLQGVALVARKDFLAAVGRHLHVADKKELPQSRVKSEALHTVREGDNELRRCAVHAVAGDDDVRARPQNVGHGAWAVVGRDSPVDGEDGADGDIAIDVGRAVERVKCDAERTPLRGVLDDNLLFLLLADQEAAHAGAAEALDPNVIRDDVELFHVVARGIGVARQTVKPSRAGLFDGVRHDLACVLDGVHQHGQLLVAFRLLNDILRQSLSVHPILQVRLEFRHDPLLLRVPAQGGLPLRRHGLVVAASLAPEHLGLQPIGADPLIIRRIIAQEVNLHRGICPLLGVRHRNNLGGVEDALGFRHELHPSLEP